MTITMPATHVVTNMPAPVSAPRAVSRPARSPTASLATRCTFDDTSGAPLPSARSVTPAKRGGRPASSDSCSSAGLK